MPDRSRSLDRAGGCDGKRWRDAGVRGRDNTVGPRIGPFERTFTLPATVDADKIRASYDHGVLAVTLPKVEKAKPRQIQVELQKT